MVGFHAKRHRAAAWHSERVLAAAPQVSIAEAKPGRIMLVGKAWPLPARKALVSAAGRQCLWYRHREKSSQTLLETRKNHITRRTYESTRPFLLVDDTGQCLVILAGADIAAGNLDEGHWHEESAILAGDTISVSGRYQDHSLNAPPVEDNDDQLPALLKSTKWPSKTTVTGTVTEVTTMDAQGVTKTSRMTSSENADNEEPIPPLDNSTFGTDVLGTLKKTVHGCWTSAMPRVLRAINSKPKLPVLPRLVKPGFGGLMIITNGKIRNTSGIFSLLSWVDRVILVCAAGMYFHWA